MIIKQTPIPVVEGAAVNRTARPAVTDGVVDLLDSHKLIEWACRDDGSIACKDCVDV